MMYQPYKMRSFHPVLCVCLAFVLLLPMVSTHALPQMKPVHDAVFTDCPSDHPYYPSVCAMHALGVVHGTGIAQITPDRAITKAEYMVFLARLFHPNAQLTALEPWYVPYEKYFVEQDIFTTVDFRGMTNPITWEFLYTSALRGCDRYPYPSALYDNMPQISESELTASSVYFLIDLGILTDIAPLQASPTRAETLDFLYQLYQSIDRCPTAFHAMGFDDQSFIVSDLRHTWRMRNGALEALTMLPRKYIDLFHQKNWRFMITDIDEVYPKYSGASGLFSGATNTIYIESTAINTTLHEFGHFLWYSLHLSKYADAMYRDEGECGGLITLIGHDYCMSDSSELFAEAFALVMEKHQTAEGRKQLEQYIPKIYACIRDGLLYTEGLVDHTVFRQYYP